MWAKQGCILRRPSRKGRPFSLPYLGCRTPFVCPEDICYLCHTGMRLLSHLRKQPDTEATALAAASFNIVRNRTLAAISLTIDLYWIIETILFPHRRKCCQEKMLDSLGGTFFARKNYDILAKVFSRCPCMKSGKF